MTCCFFIFGNVCWDILLSRGFFCGINQRQMGFSCLDVITMFGLQLDASARAARCSFVSAKASPNEEISLRKNETQFVLWTLLSLLLLMAHYTGMRVTLYWTENLGTRAWHKSLKELFLLSFKKLLCFSNLKHSIIYIQYVMFFLKNSCSKVKPHKFGDISQFTKCDSLIPGRRPSKVYIWSFTLLDIVSWKIFRSCNKSYDALGTV